jgi:hypothetical protein
MAARTVAREATAMAPIGPAELWISEEKANAEAKAERV